MPFSALDGLFYRIVPRTRAAQTLAPAISPEGRFHHSDQPSLYVSSRPDSAFHAIQTYVRDTDPPRVICELRLNALTVLDLRNPDHCKASGIDPALAAIPWLPQRARPARPDVGCLRPRPRVRCRRDDLHRPNRAQPLAPGPFPLAGRKPDGPGSALSASRRTPFAP